MSYALLLAALVGLLLASPVLAESEWAWIIRYALVPAVLVTATFAGSRTPATRRLALVLLAANLACEAWALAAPGPAASMVGRALSAVFFGFVAVVMLRHVMGHEFITRDAILGAVCAYLLIGAGFYHVYGLLEVWSPGSFAASGAPLAAAAEASPQPGRNSLLLYYSFVTLTTLGYGDVTPTHPLARSLATLEAILGQFYVAILIGHLVGMRLAQLRERRGPERRAPRPPPRPPPG